MDENGQEFYLISIPKKIKPRDLEGMKIDLNRSNQMLYPSRDDDETEITKFYGCDIHRSNHVQQNISRVRPSGTDDETFEIDSGSKIAGCINIYKQLGYE